MRILLVSPAPVRSTRGNQISAVRWKSILEELGHSVEVRPSREFLDLVEGDLPKGRSPLDPEVPSEAARFYEADFDCLIALHARQSSAAVRWFRSRYPDRPLLVCLTGTDLHSDLSRQSFQSQADVETNYRLAMHSIELADRLILLEPEGIQRLPERFQAKCQVILQSAMPASKPGRPSSDHFQVSVIGHLRPVKDPFRTAKATRWLPPTSRISVIQVGEALSGEMKQMARAEEADNPRYRWIGPVSHEEALRHLTESHLTVLSSISEGGPSILSEAIVNQVPVLVSRIDATLGILGRDYEGFFEVGDTEQLARLMDRAETDQEFLQRLREQVSSLSPRFSPENEKTAWRHLLESLEK